MAILLVYIRGETIHNIDMNSCLFQIRFPSTVRENGSAESTHIEGE